MSVLATWRYMVAVASGYLASLVAFPDLPGFRPGGEPLFARLLVALLLPTTAAAIYMVIRSVWARDPVRDADAVFEPTYGAITFAVVLFVIAIHLMVVAALTGILTERDWLIRTTIVLFGAMLVKIGNVLPRTRPNLALGIRTPQTLADRRLWMQTHRMAGYIAVGLGVVFALSGAFLSKPMGEPVMGLALLGATVAMIASYGLYAFRRQPGL